jgi:hypothetical protein
MFPMPLGPASPRSKHLKLLEPWAQFAERFWYDLPGHGGLGCFGTGYGSWGVQTNQKYLAAIAVLAMDPATDVRAVGLSQEQLMDRAMAALRYSLATHTSGTVRRTDGSQWGHTWISGLGIERMMHAVDALGDHLSDEDRDGLQRVLTSEAAWIFESHPVKAGRWASEGANVPESNYWNGAILLRTAMMYPDIGERDQWTERGIEFLVNAISVPADAEDATVVDGRPVRERHVGANFFPNYALDHHAYLNVGYAVICLSNVAMLHYAYALRGLEAPQAVYHHGRDLWNVVRRLVFADGRLARIGGDSRQRYCYCQDYLLPVLVMAADLWDDPLAAHLEAGQLDIIATEQQHNGNGSFLSKRLDHLGAMSPYYYTRLEADKAVCLSMAAQWRRQRPDIASPQRSPKAAQFEADLAGGWEEPEHGAIMHRSPTRLVSWSARACECPQGLCLPPDDGSPAEWSECLAGRVTPLGEQTHPGDERSVHTRRRHMQSALEGGFVVCTTTTDGAKVNMPEGYRAEDIVEHHVAFAALPDGHTALRLELAVNGPRRIYLRDVRGLKLNVANDLFNGGVRTLHDARGSHRVETSLESVEQAEPLLSAWANADDRIGVVAVYGSDGLLVYRTGTRRGGYAGSIAYDELCTSVRLGTHDVDAGATILDNGTVIFASVDHDATRQYADDHCAARAACSSDAARAIVAKGRDDRRYLLAANFADDECGNSQVRVTVPGDRPVAAVDLTTGEQIAVDGDTATVNLEPGQAKLLRLGRD